jgi:hypothetical protein
LKRPSAGESRSSSFTYAHRRLRRRDIFRFVRKRKLPREARYLRLFVRDDNFKR